MKANKALRCVGVGAGYFSHYHYDAWRRIEEVDLLAIADCDRSRAERAAQEFNVSGVFADYRAMLDSVRPDFVDIITPPETHVELCKAAFERGVNVICQKPLAPSYAECAEIVDAAREAGLRFMVHENWRWQPWYREIRHLLDSDVVGEVFTVNFRMRTGDGWGDDAYLDRQPFFRNYSRLLVYETGIHFIDTFRYLLGEVESVYARLRRLNPAIAGEDCGQLILGFANGATAIWDSNRYNESGAVDPRYTFGELRADARKGHLIMDSSGDICIKLLGCPGYKHEYPHSDAGFAGDCVFRLQRHFVDSFLDDAPFESSGEDYLKTVQIVEACYASAESGHVVRL